MTRAASTESLLQAVRECAELAGSVAFAHYRKACRGRVEARWITRDRGGSRGGGGRARVDPRALSRGRILGEEFGEMPGTSGRRWVIDPIDGTKAFVRGVPLWGSLVAVVEDERVLAGAACFPATGESIAAAVGCGSWHDRTRARVSTVADLGSATVLVTDAARVRVSGGA